MMEPPLIREEGLIKSYADSDPPGKKKKITSGNNPGKEDENPQAQSL
jgi:hypothetical protein